MRPYRTGYCKSGDCDLLVRFYESRGAPNVDILRVREDANNIEK